MATVGFSANGLRYLERRLMSSLEECCKCDWLYGTLCPQSILAGILFSSSRFLEWDKGMGERNEKARGFCVCVCIRGVF